MTIKDASMTTHWASGTNSGGTANGPYTLNLQSDNNLVLRNKNNTAIWSSLANTLPVWNVTPDAVFRSTPTITHPICIFDQINYAGDGICFSLSDTLYTGAAGSYKILNGCTTKLFYPKNDGTSLTVLGAGNLPAEFIGNLAEFQIDTTCNAGVAPLCIYSLTSYLGREECFSTGTFNLERDNGSNVIVNTMKSLKLAPGCKAFTFNGFSGSGTSATWTVSAATLSAFNNTVSSLKVECN